jgi:hypothetical protein
LKTPVGEHFTVPGVFGPVEYSTYPCKFEDECGRYNPARTVTVTVGIKDHPETNREIVKPNLCVVGGGCACASWRHYTSKDIGFFDPLMNRSFSPKTFNKNRRIAHVEVAEYTPPEIPVIVNASVDAQETQIKKLKAMEMLPLC